MELNDKGQTQEGNTTERILNDSESISFISRFITLNPGDLVLTGTPKGALDSIVTPGDRVRHRVDGIGDLEFEVVTNGVSRSFV